MTFRLYNNKNYNRSRFGILCRYFTFYFSKYNIRALFQYIYKILKIKFLLKIAFQGNWRGKKMYVGMFYITDFKFIEKLDRN